MSLIVKHCAACRREVTIEEAEGRVIVGAKLVGYGWNGWLVLFSVAIIFGHHLSSHLAFGFIVVVDKSAVRVRRMFGQIAGRYDFLNHLLSLNTDKYWRWQTVRKVPPMGDGPILDLCTGTGDLAIAYQKAGRGQARVVGADFCHEMLVIGRRKGYELHGIEFVEADAMQLPFPDNYFQIVSVAFGLRNVTNTERGLTEMARVCRPGGKVVVLEFSTPSWQPFRGFYLWYFKNVLPKIGQLLARNQFDAYSYLPQSVGEFPSGQALAEKMEAVGLEPVHFHPLTLGVATLYVGTKPSSLNV